MAGCEVQKSYGNCIKCDKGYTLNNGECRAAITKLTWNDVDMDFWDDEDSSSSGKKCKKESEEVFSVGVGSKLNL